jgi:hypothetical protein
MKKRRGFDVITPMIAEVHEAYDSIVKKNYEAWQEACSKRKSYLEPLDQIKVAVSRKVASYEAEQRSKQQEAERLAWEAAELAAAERVEGAIEYAEAHGATPDEVRAMIEQPAARPKPAVAATIERVPWIIRRSAYKAEVVNLRELARDVAEGNCPEAYLRPNETALNAAARSLGPELMRFVRGVRVVEVNTRRGKEEITGRERQRTGTRCNGNHARRFEPTAREIQGSNCECAAETPDARADDPRGADRCFSKPEAFRM